MSLQDDLDDIYSNKAAQQQLKEKSKEQEQQKAILARQRAEEQAEQEEWSRARDVVNNLHDIVIKLARADKYNSRNGVIFSTSRVKTIEHSVGLVDRFFGVSLPPNSVPEYYCDKASAPRSKHVCKQDCGKLVGYTTFEIPPVVEYILQGCTQLGITVELKLIPLTVGFERGPNSFGSTSTHTPAKISIVARW